MEQIILSGFSDEIAPEFDVQLEAIREFGLSHIELRAADGVNVSDFTKDKVKEIKEKLDAAGIAVSSIGSPIGKIGIEDEFAPHLDKLKRTLEIQKELDAPYVRMFSFYLPKDRDPGGFPGRKRWTPRRPRMVEEAKAWDSVLLHENEEGIIWGQCSPVQADPMDAFYGPNYPGRVRFCQLCGSGPRKLCRPTELMKPYVEYVHIKDALKKEKKAVPVGVWGRPRERDPGAIRSVGAGKDFCPCNPI